MNLYHWHYGKAGFEEECDMVVAAESIQQVEAILKNYQNDHSFFNSNYGAVAHIGYALEGTVQGILIVGYSDTN